MKNGELWNKPSPVKKDKKPFVKTQRDRNSPTKAFKLFLPINEVEEDIKGLSDEEELHNLSLRDKKHKSNFKGILALTQENLRKLDLKNQVNFLSLTVI